MLMMSAQQQQQRTKAAYKAASYVLLLAVEIQFKKTRCFRSPQKKHSTFVLCGFYACLSNILYRAVFHHHHHDHYNCHRHRHHHHQQQRHHHHHHQFPASGFDSLLVVLRERVIYVFTTFP